MLESQPFQLENQNILFVVNPRAGNGLSLSERKSINDVGNSLSNFGSNVDIVETTAPGHATEIADEAILDNVHSIIAVGGDGTLNEVMQSMASSGVALGNIPTGLFNIWANEMRIPEDIEKAGQLLFNSEVRAVDVGCINDTLFLQFANFGFDSEQYMKVHQPGSVRKRSGRMTFAQTFARSLIDGWSYRGHRATVNNDNEQFELDRLLIGTIANSRKYGFLTLNEETVLDDGKLEVTLLEGKLGPQFLVQFAGIALHRDNIPGLRRGILKANTSFTINSQDKIGITIDGNPLGYTNTITASVLPDSLRVIIPQNASLSLFKEK